MRSTTLGLILLLSTGPAASQAAPERDSHQTVERAVALAEQGRIDQALELLRPLADRPDASLEVLVNASRAAFSVGDEAAAEGWMERAIELAPGSEAARGYGFYLGQQGRFADARRVLAPYVELRGDDAAAALALATADLKIGALDDAARVLERLPEDHPGAILLRGELALERLEPHRARRLLESVWESHPPELELDLRRLLAQVYLAIGDAPRAVEMLTGLERDPATSLVLSIAHYQSGEPERAAETLAPLAAQVAAVDDAAPPSVVDLAVRVATEYSRALVASDRAEEVVDLMRRAVRLRPRSPEAWNVLGHALIATGDMEEARSAIQHYHDLKDALVAGDPEPLDAEEEDHATDAA